MINGSKNSIAHYVIYVGPTRKNGMDGSHALEGISSCEIVTCRWLCLLQHPSEHTTPHVSQALCLRNWSFISWNIKVSKREVTLRLRLFEENCIHINVCYSMGHKHLRDCTARHGPLHNKSSEPHSTFVISCSASQFAFIASLIAWMQRCISSHSCHKMQMYWQAFSLKSVISLRESDLNPWAVAQKRCAVLVWGSMQHDHKGSGIAMIKLALSRKSAGLPNLVTASRDGVNSGESTQ